MDLPVRKIVNHLCKPLILKISPASSPYAQTRTGVSISHMVGTSLVALAGIFTVDIYVPQGVASGVAYVVPVLISSWMQSGRYIAALAFAGTFLTIAGFLASPSGGYEWQVLSNRALALFVIWFSASLVHYCRHMDANRDILVKEFAVTTEIARLINSSLNINELYDPISDAIRQFISLDRIHLGLVDYDGSTTTPVWKTETGLSGRRMGAKIPFEGRLAGEVVRTRLPPLTWRVTASDLEHQFPLVFSPFNACLRSFMAIPLIDHDLVVGVLQIDSKNIGAYSQRHLELADRIASQISGAIANSQLNTDHRRLA